MPITKALSSTWDVIFNEVVAVHARWIIFRQLFAGSAERISILNESAAAFFYVVQATFLDDVQLTLSKLADPAVTFGRRNASLEHLTQLIAALGEQALADQLNVLLMEYRTSCKQIMTRRNRWIAHYDRETLSELYGHSELQVAGASRKEIEDALAALRRFMKPVEKYFTGSETAFEHFISREDGNSLIAILRQGLRYQDLVRDRVIQWDDLRNSTRFGD